MLACSDFSGFYRDRTSQRDSDDSFDDIGSLGCTAIFLILELDRPFSGVLRISNEPMLNVLNQLAQRNP